MNAERWVSTGLLLLVSGGLGVARADSLGSSPGAARSYCQTTKHATTAEALQACCDDTILEDPPAKQKRWVKECVTGVAQPKSPEEIAYAGKQRADLAAERERRAANEAAGGKVGRKRATSAIPPADGDPVPGAGQAPQAEPTGAASAASATSAASSGESPAQVLNKAQPDCRKNPTRAALSSLGSLVRRMGANVPSIDCP